jgi:hypothetical protein
MRRKGQGLEFYDYRPYIPGDDVRHIDWRASARHGSAEDLLIRTYAAEEQLTLIISLDTRPTMKMPDIMPKSLIAGWLAEAIAWITLRSGDRIVLHRLFGGPGGSIRELYGTRDAASLRLTLDRLLAYESKNNALNTAVLDRYLKPAVIWLIISDFYFDMDSEGKTLGGRIAQAQDGMRWIILIDTDSWPYEKLNLGQGPRKIEGPGLPMADRPLDIDGRVILNVENTIKTHKKGFHDRVNRGAFDYIAWKWPETESPDPRTFFQDRFGGERVLQRLFMREHQ